MSPFDHYKKGVRTDIRQWRIQTFRCWEGGGGGLVIQTLRSEIRDRGGVRSPKKFFSTLRASLWSKNKGDPLDPPLLDDFFLLHFS